MALRIGTCGWQYRDWRGRFYPERLPQRSWLEYYAGRFDTVEIDSSFYRLPERTAFERWAATVPAGFRFASKASRYLTHIRRLADPAEPVARLMDRLEGLGERTGPVLVQLPPTLAADHDRLEATLRAFPAGVAVAVEFRHPSWDVVATRRVLERHGATRCLADRRGPIGAWEAVSGWGYVRFHDGRAADGNYGRAALRAARERLAAHFSPGDDVWVYFNNDHLAAAPANARSMERLSDHLRVD